MADITSADVQPRRPDHPLGRPSTTGRWLLSVFGPVLAAGLIYIVHSLGQDL